MSRAENSFEALVSRKVELADQAEQARLAEKERLREKREAEHRRNQERLALLRPKQAQIISVMSGMAVDFARFMRSKGLEPTQQIVVERRQKQEQSPRKGIRGRIGKKAPVSTYEDVVGSVWPVYIEGHLKHLKGGTGHYSYNRAIVTGLAVDATGEITVLEAFIANTAPGLRYVPEPEPVTTEILKSFPSIRLIDNSQPESIVARSKVVMGIEDPRQQPIVIDWQDRLATIASQAVINVT